MLTGSLEPVHGTSLDPPLSTVYVTVPFSYRMYSSRNRFQPNQVLEKKGETNVYILQKQDLLGVFGGMHASPSLPLPISLKRYQIMHLYRIST